MKLIPTLAALAVGASLALPGAFAQDVALKATIPFSFTVGGMTMPAGSYLISSTSNNIVRIENIDPGRADSATLTTRRSFQDPGKGSKLVFSKYGEFYFLHSVLSSQTVHLNVNLPPSKAEKRIRSGEARLNQEEQVLLAAN